MDKNFNEEEFLEKVKLAAEEGAKKGYKAGFGTEIFKMIFSKIVIPTLIIMAVMMLVLPKLSFTGFSGLFNVEAPVEGHDYTIENHGLLGYTAADFAEPILSDKTKLKKIEVLQYKVTGATTITNAGLLKLEIFSKTKLITYHGIATYSVDLSGFSVEDLTVDNDNRKVIMVIPHAELDPINIPASEIEYGDTEKGMLAFGELKLTPEQQGATQAEAAEKMKIKLLDDNIQAEADKFAKQVIWEIYQPIINTVAPGYSLEIYVGI